MWLNQQNVISHKQEKEALLSLRMDESIVAQKADKRNPTVLLDSSNYHSKVMTIINEEAFSRLKKDPTCTIEWTLTRLSNETNWADNIKTALTPRASVPTHPQAL